MKRLSIAAGMLLLVATSLTSCRETTEKETVVREVEVEKKVDTPEEEEKEGILERTAKEVDQEVNEEIDKEIDKIGDDNS